MKLKNELPLIAIVAIPFAYLAYIWNELPGKVPVHWNINGEVDRYGNKAELILIPVILPLLIYLIFLVVPKIDPKNKIGKMGKKYQNIKTLLTVLMSILATFLIYTAKNQSLTNPNYVVLLLGVLYIILGNYFKTIKPNYFIGIRTPWTLESETVWKDTHKLGGKLWFGGGFIVVISSLLLSKEADFKLFMIITGIIAIIPVVYSYFRFRKLEKSAR
ncbi:MAG: DUF1648 domain-containing protein [Chlorobi bacterium]|nr:DUF1648 domain-containing protein [Chlorobiota bacterium]